MVYGHLYNLYFSITLDKFIGGIIYYNILLHIIQYTVHTYVYVQ